MAWGCLCHHWGGGVCLGEPSGGCDDPTLVPHDSEHRRPGRTAQFFVLFFLVFVFCFGVVVLV